MYLYIDHEELIPLRDINTNKIIKIFGRIVDELNEYNKGIHDIFYMLLLVWICNFIWYDISFLYLRKV